jgi:hypothetical protein
MYCSDGICILECQVLVTKGQFLLLCQVEYFENKGRKEQILALEFLFLFLKQQTNPPPPQWTRASSFTRFLDHTQ